MNPALVKYATLRRLRKVVDTWKSIDELEGLYDVVYYGGSLGWQSLETYRTYGDKLALIGLIAHAFRSDGSVPSSLAIALTRHSVVIADTGEKMRLWQDTERRWDLLPKGKQDPHARRSLGLLPTEYNPDFDVKNV